MIDFKVLSSITGKSLKELKAIHNSWIADKKNHRGTVDLKLLSLFSGLSTASISVYINKKGSISKEKAAMLDRIITCISYTPSYAAKRLRSLEKKCIGFTAPITVSPNPSFYIDILKGVKAEAKKFGYYVDIFDVGENEEEEFFHKAPYIGMVDGLITASLDLENRNLDALVNDPLPIVNIHSWSKPSRKPIINTLVPNTRIFRDLMEYLLGEKKFREPVLISLHPKNHMVRNQKITYFKQAMKDCNLQFDEKKHIQYIKQHTLSDARDAFRKIESSNFSPDVYVCLSDIVATSICRELQKSGRNTAVTGHDNSAVSTLFNLTTIDQKMHETGRIAFERLYVGIRYILENNDFPEYSETELKHELIIRE